MGLNASAAFNFLNLNNAYTNSGSENNSSNQEEQNFTPLSTAGSVSVSDGTYNMPQGSIYDTAGSIAYNYYNTSFSSSNTETAGSIASSSTSFGGSVSSAASTSSTSASTTSSASSGGSSTSSGSVV